MCFWIFKPVTPPYPLLPASFAYKDRDQPIRRSDVMDLIRQLFAVIAPLVGCLALHSYNRWRQSLRFPEYFRQLQRFDLMAKGLLADGDLPPDSQDHARYPKIQLETLQRKALEDFCRNYFYREGVLYTFLSVFAETRNYLRTSTPIAHNEQEEKPAN